MKTFAWIGAGFSAFFVLLTFSLSSALSGGSAAGWQGTGYFDDTASTGLNAEQVRNAEISMRVADHELADETVAVASLARLAMTVSALGESNFLVVPNAKGSGYCGVYQADPKNVPCDDTKEQATRFMIGGKGFQAGGAIRLATTSPSLSPGTIATLVEASGQPGSFYDVHRPQAERIIAAWRAGGRTALEPPPVLGDIDGKLTPKQVIDQIVLPVARKEGIQVTAKDIEEANARHSVDTTSGNVSEHKGPPEVAWAADMSDNWVTTIGSPRMTRLASALAKMFDVDWPGSGLVNSQKKVGRCLFRFQLIYLTFEGGDHFNHVHLGVHLISCT